MSSGGHIRQRSPGTWEVRYRANGVQRTKTVRGSKADAQRMLRAALNAVDQGTHVARVGLTVGDLLRQRIKTWQASGRITVRTAESYAVAANIAAPIADVLLQQLSIGHVEHWHLAMRQRGLSASSTRAAHGLVRRALADAVKHRLVARNVALDHGAPTVEPAARSPAPNADQVHELLAKLAGHRFEAAAIIAVYCGLRRGEQLALRWSSIDLDGARLRVVEALEQSSVGVSLKRPKTAAGLRSISLPSIAVEALRAHHKAQLERCLLLGLGRPPDDALVFPDEEGGHQVPRAFSQRWMRLAARLGMPEITWHSLRHAHASMLIREGVPITEVADRLGHANPMVTLTIYAHLFARDDRGAADAIDRMLGRGSSR